jgi:REP element-mobilizing transposase RayT
MAERLRRLQWLFERNPIYFATANTHGRRNILATAAIHKSLQSFAQSGSEHGAWLGAYVLMPDHMHAFVALDDRVISLSAWVKSLKNAVKKSSRLCHSSAALAERVFRSRSAQRRVLLSKVALCLRESGTSWFDFPLGRLPYLGEPHPLEYRKL